VVVLKVTTSAARPSFGARLGAGAAMRLVDLDVLAGGLLVVGAKAWL
jgi:hypothetical protein